MLRYRTVNSALAGIGALLFVAGCGGGGGGTSSSAPAPSNSGDRGILIQLQPGTDVAALAQEYGATIDGSDPENNLYRFHPGDGNGNGPFLDHLKRDGRFLSAETDGGVRVPEFAQTVVGFPIHVPFDFVEPSSSKFTEISTTYRSVATSTTTNTAADTVVDFGNTTALATGVGVTVAVLDTGVMADHPSLRSHLTDGFNAISAGASPADIADGTQNTAVGHGTMVAGVIARLAPDARIMPVRVLNGDGTGSVFDVVQGMHWAISHGARVINLSFGTTDSSGILQGAVSDARRAGVIVVASAGNSGQDTRDYPAGFSGVLAVAAVENDGHKSDYSNYGSYISLDAPGSGIQSTYTNGGFASWSGTSFAAPFVSAAAALVLSTQSGQDAGKAIERLQKNAHSLDATNPGYSGKLGWGLLDIQQSVADRTVRVGRN